MSDFGAVLIAILIIGGGFLSSVMKENQQSTNAANAQKEFENLIKDCVEKWGFTESESKTVYNGYLKYHIAIDKEKKEWFIVHNHDGKSVAIKFPFSSLCTYMVSDNFTSVQDGMGRSGKAVVGGVLGGTTGAIAGAVSDPKMKAAKDVHVLISTNDSKYPDFTIKLANAVAVGSDKYWEVRNAANEICDILAEIKSNA